MTRKTAWPLCFLAVAVFALPAAAQQAPVEPVIVPSPPDYSRTALLPADAQPPPAVAQPPVVLPQGTALSIQFNKDMRLKSPGSTFQAALSDDLRVGGKMIAPRGTLVRGELISSFNSQGSPEPALSLTEIWLNNDWRSLDTEPLPVEARRGSGKGRKFLAGLALASVVAGEALAARSRGGYGSCPRQRRSSPTGAALRSAGNLSALLLARGAGAPRWGTVKLKRGRQMSFQLLEDLAFEQR